MPTPRRALPRSALDAALWAKRERDADLLESVLRALRGEEGPLWLWAGTHAALVCSVYSRAATVECIGFDPGDPGAEYGYEPPKP